MLFSVKGDGLMVGPHPVVIDDPHEQRRLFGSLSRSTDVTTR